MASFIPKSITYFNEKFECKPPFKKFGPLCYTNEENDKTCANIGYETCGFAACSVTNKDCAKVVTGMVLSTVVGVLKFATLILNPANAVESLAKGT